MGGGDPSWRRFLSETLRISLLLKSRDAGFVSMLFSCIQPIEVD
jgi:hypothetical protein